MLTTDPEFAASLEDDACAAHWSPALRALWFEARGDWDSAHREIEHEKTTEAFQVHAYLHRKEGKSDNAAFCYGRAGIPPVTGPVAEERDALVRRLMMQHRAV